MKKSNKIYIIGWCYDDGIIRSVYGRAYKNWFHAVAVSDRQQRMLNQRIKENRHSVIIGVRPDYVNNKIEGTILKKVCRHHYNDTEWL